MRRPGESMLPMTEMPSPNFGERVGVSRPDMLLLHYTGMSTGDAALQRLCSPASKVSAHYVVRENGEIVRSVAEAQRAWHAGLAHWAGADDINSHAIGIEIVNPGHDEGYPEFPDVQIEAVIALARDIAARQGIAADRVLAHSDVAPLRKRDPGEKFPWGRLHAAGVGHWIPPAPRRAGDADLAGGSAGPAVSNLQNKLKIYGYGIQINGIYDPLTEAVVAAFQRHFRPATVDGIADDSTLETLDELLASRPAAVI